MLYEVITGVFVNYLSDVLPIERKFVTPFCLNCRTSQPWFNYFIWPRRCQQCGKRRPLRVWVVEFIFVISSVWIWLTPPADLGYILGLILLAYFGIVVVIDVEHRLILNPVSLWGAILVITSYSIHYTKLYDISSAS